MPTTLGPLPRKVDGLHTRVVGDEVIVLDEATKTAHVLQGPAAALWLTLDKGEWPAGAEAAVRQAAQELEEAGLVRASGLTRRRMLLHSGAVVAGGTVLSMGLPSVAAADSAPIGTVTSISTTTPQPQTGTSVTFSVVVAPASGTAAPSGSVILTRSTDSTFSRTAALSPTGTASFTVTAGAASVEETFTATYVPQPGFSSSVGTTKITPVAAPTPQKPKPTVEISYTPTSPTVGQALSVTVTVKGTAAAGAPTGTVTLSVNGTNGSPSTLTAVSGTNNSTAVFTVPYGTNPATLKATYNPPASGAYETASSGDVTVTYAAAQKITPTITFTPGSITGDNTKTRRSYQLTVTVAGPPGSPLPTGSVSLSASVTSGNAPVVTAPTTAQVVNGSHTFTVTNGTSNNTAVTLTATYIPGNAGNYNGQTKTISYTQVN